ncbi:MULTISPECIES: tyrosine-type recombinase/integrase [Sphingomonas]|jgi:integrase|uniref:tyrosine-type recombinase/integrase n=1 Tax=Sphingomonas TaxID=13687 RepID=UPI000829CE7B|nr:MULTISPECIES: integrase arm-type DNA-binding domain-containing protein [Sphingomonas]MBY0300796.1 tyrosine-type recombinase/integrase [Sphingomonas ginsenosidimutans]
MGKLNTLAIKALTAPGRYADGDGLYLVIKGSGSRSWVLLIQWNGRRREFGLGSAKTVGVKEARQRATETRRQAEAGTDPAEAKRASRRILAAMPTFREAALAVHSERERYWKNPKHRAQWLSTLQTYAFPSIGGTPVDKVAGPAIRDLLAPIWNDKPETARRVLQRIKTVLDWAHAKGHRAEEAPLRSVKTGLARQTTRPGNFAALPYQQVEGLMAKLIGNDTAGRLALQFVILTAARSGEVIGATWEEIDFAGALWTIPASRMKAQKEHLVPLSPAALAVLRVAESMRKGIAGEPVFPGPSGKPLSDATMRKALRTAVGGTWTVHGLRSSFRDWAAEATTFPSEAAEAALAHVIPSKTVKSYLRSIYLDIRRTMMTDWATFVGAGAPPMLKAA